MSSSLSSPNSVTEDAELLRHLSRAGNTERGVALPRNNEEEDNEDREKDERDEEDDKKGERLERIQSPLI